MKHLTVGGNTELPQEKFVLHYDLPEAADVSIFFLNNNGKVLGDDGMVFYGIPNSVCGTVKLLDGSIEFNLNNIPAGIEKLAITATLESDANWDNSISLKSDAFECAFKSEDRPETALILLQIYKRNDTWKVKLVGQGFNGGLVRLAEFYGVEIEAEIEEVAEETEIEVKKEAPKEPPVAAPSALNLIALTKENPTVYLVKQAGDLGVIKASLQWTQPVSGISKKRMDLDLGAYIELNNGNKKIIQALGGDVEYAPYITLLKDERSGGNTDGESLHIDGNEIQNVKRITLFAFVYEGSVNWIKADAKVTLDVPSMVPIEMRVTENSFSKRFCAIAELTVNEGFIKVEQLNRLFAGHQKCDKAFGWGFKWKRSNK